MRPSELATVLSNYDVTSWRKGPALYGATSTNTVVYTRQRPLILKKKTGHVSSKTIREHALLEHLVDTRFPVPRLVKNAEGLTYTESFGSHYTLAEFVEGLSFTRCSRHLGTDEPMIRAAGSSLALLHQEIANFSSDGEFRRLVEQDSPANMDWRFDVIDRLLDCRSGVADGHLSFLQEIAGPVKQQLLEAQSFYEATDLDVPVQLVHFDYAPKNLIFGQDGSIIGILDFGNMCVDLRVADLERFIFTFRPSALQPPDQRRASIFLEAYRQHQNLSDEEIRRIPDFARWRRVRRIVRVMEAAVRTRSDAGRRHNYSLSGGASVEELWADIYWLKTHANMIADKFAA